jgi:hypothetical protein
MKNDVKSAHGALGQQLAELLYSQSIVPLKNANCEICGSRMQFKEFHFWLAETAMTWNIRLPVCATCAGPRVPKPLGYRDAA